VLREAIDYAPGREEAATAIHWDYERLTRGLALGKLWPERVPVWGAEGRALYVTAKSTFNVSEGPITLSVSGTDGGTGGEASFTAAQEPPPDQPPVPPRPIIVNAPPQTPRTGKVFFTSSAAGMVEHPTPVESEVVRRMEEAQPEPLISVYFDDSDFTPEDVQLFLTYLSETYREMGGTGLKVVGGKSFIAEGVEVER
jgi:hypothetical protein